MRSVEPQVESEPVAFVEPEPVTVDETVVAEEAEIVETDAGRAARSYDEQPWVIEDDNEARSAYGWFVPRRRSPPSSSRPRNRRNRRRRRRTRSHRCTRRRGAGRRRTRGGSRG